MRISIYFAFIFTFQFSFADILYIDANDTQNEIKIFKEYAQCRGEKLVVLPKEEDREMYKERGRQIQKKKLEKTQIEDQLKKQCNCIVKDHWSDLRCHESLWRDAELNKPTACTQLINDWRVVFKQVSETMPSRYHSRDLRKDLIELFSDSHPEKTYDFNTVVISGHHYLNDDNYDKVFEPGGFQGLTAWFKEEELTRAFFQLPNLYRIKSLFLLGCKPLYIKQSKDNWRRVFSNTGFIGGYSVNGYLNSDPKGNKFIRDLLSVHEDTLAKIEENLDETQLRKSFDGIMNAGLTGSYSSFRIFTQAQGKDITYDFKSASKKTQKAVDSSKPLCRRPKQLEEAAK